MDSSYRLLFEHGFWGDRHGPQ